jgi:integrase
MRKKLVDIKHWPSLTRYPFVVVYKQGGKRRVQRYFRTEREAKSFSNLKWVELTNEGRKHAEITDAERRAVIAAREAGVKLQDLIDTHLEEHAQNARSVRIDVAIDEFLEVRENEGKARAHIKDLHTKVRAFARVHGQRLVSEISTRDVDAQLAGLVCAAQTKLNYRRGLHNFFNFCLQRGYTRTNPVSASARPKVISKAPGILTPEQTRAMLGECSSAILPAVAIAAFAGLRASEIARLTWDKVNVERGRIEVSALHSKTGRRRLVTVSPNLKAWLNQGANLRLNHSGPVRPAANTYERLFSEALKRAKIDPWPRNALRHSCASYLLAETQNAALTAFQLGHSESVLNQHYRELVTPEAAHEYFSIMPCLDKTQGMS